jgi:hypothetical protein
MPEIYVRRSSKKKQKLGIQRLDKKEFFFVRRITKENILCKMEVIVKFI